MARRGVALAAGSSDRRPLGSVNVIFDCFLMKTFSKEWCALTVSEEERNSKAMNSSRVALRFSSSRDLLLQLHRMPYRIYLRRDAKSSWVSRWQRNEAGQVLLRVCSSRLNYNTELTKFSLLVAPHDLSSTMNGHTKMN